MYDEALDDPKVQRLSPEDFKFWVNCLMLANRHSGVLPPLADIVFAFRMDEIAIVSALDRLVYIELIDILKGGINGRRFAPHGWDKRQYKSDTSTERVKRFRDKTETVSETPLRARSESDQIRAEQKEERSSIDDPKKKRGARISDDWVPTDASIAYAEERFVPESEVGRFIDHWLQSSKTDAVKCDWQAAWRTWCRNHVKFNPPPQSQNGGLFPAVARVIGDPRKTYVDGKGITRCR